MISQFQTINHAYNTVFQPNRLSIGFVVPIENYAASPVPSMQGAVRRVQLAEEFGFSAVWLRDVPFNVPSFGDAGQVYDPFVYLGYLAAQTSSIALGVSSIILPLRHPAHVAKAAASADVLSDGRLLLGIASGDRPEEYPALNMTFEDRGARFRESYDYMREMGKTSSQIENNHGRVYSHMQMLPKPVSNKLPMLITGSSQQSPDWIAQNGDGWMMYPRGTDAQAQVITEYRARLEAHEQPNKPIMQPLYIDLADDPNGHPFPIHLGFCMGVNHLITYFKTLESIGVNHVAINLRFNRADIEKTIAILAEKLLPEFK